MTRQRQLLALRVYACCHGLGFHNALILPWLKQNFDNSSYEAVFILLALQTLSQMVTEAYSGWLSEKEGSWYVLQLCTQLRFCAFCCLGIVGMFTCPFWVMVVILILWSICEGVGTAMYSGADVALIYQLSEKDEIRGNLSYQDMAWPFSRVLSGLVAHWLLPNFCAQVLASLLSLAAAWYLLSDYPSFPSTTTEVTSPLSPKENAHWFPTRSLYRIYNDHALYLTVLYLILVHMQVETMHKLLPFIVSKENLPFCVSLGFLGSTIGSWLAGRTQEDTQLWLCQILFGTVAGCWALVLTLTNNHIVFLISTSSIGLSIAWGYHKTSTKRQLLETIPNDWCKVDFLSTLKLTTQCAHMSWMCMVISPLLDHASWSMSHIFILLSCLTFVTWNLRLNVHTRKNKYSK